MKTWLITGCSSGIGKGIAKAVLESGDQAIITARNTNTLKDMISEYDNAYALALDVCDNDQIKDVVQKGIERFGSIDVLVNNAGYGYRSALEEGDIEEVNKLYQTNVFGPVELMKAVLPGMRERRLGFILNVTSIAAARSAIGSSYYASSKASLELLTNGLMKEVAPLGIHAIVIQPGAFRTRFYDDTSLKGTQKEISDYEDTVGKTRVGNFDNKHAQPGDPMRAGKVIVDLIHGDKYPEILTLGESGALAVKQTLQAKIDEIDEWMEVSKQCDFDKE